MTTLALAELAAEKSNKLKEKYINLILFRNPEDEKAEEEDEEKPPGQNKKDKKKRRMLFSSNQYV